MEKEGSVVTTHSEKEKANMKISVIIPTIDRPSLIEAVSTAQSQKGVILGHDYEVITSTGGNQSYNINKAIKEAKGDYIKILHDDDLLPDNSIHDYISNIDGHDIYFANAFNFGGDNWPFRQHSEYENYFKLAQKNTIHGGTYLFKKSLFEDGGYNEKLTTGEEYEFVLRKLRRGATIKKIDSFTYVYRLHEGNKHKHRTEKELKQLEQIRNEALSLN